MQANLQASELPCLALLPISLCWCTCWLVDVVGGQDPLNAASTSLGQSDESVNLRRLLRLWQEDAFRSLFLPCPHPGPAQGFIYSSFRLLVLVACQKEAAVLSLSLSLSLSPGALYLRTSWLEHPVLLAWIRANLLLPGYLIFAVASALLIITEFSTSPGTSSQNLTGKFA